MRNVRLIRTMSIAVRADRHTHVEQRKMVGLITLEEIRVRSVRDVGGYEE